MRFLLSVVVLLASVTYAHARPAHKQSLAEHFGPHLPKKLNDCRTCHVPDAPGAKHELLAEDKPHNVFGKRLKALRAELRQVGKKAAIAERLEAVAEEDSDGDGVTNLLEILSGRYPGDPTDTPTREEISQARRTLIAFTKFKSAYPWRPYEVVKRPAVPQVKNTAWVRNPIDAFIAAEHEARGLSPRPEAPKHVLLRRAYFDLIGLPPTRAELQAFQDESAPDAYEKVVDRLLQDPRQGERWGRHWMDVWRYSDWAGWTDGGQIRDSQPHIWRWRDWIVESLNEDKPYDRMIVEMLAADEATPEDENALRATGYLVRNYKMLSREKWLQDTVDHTFQAFLGTTVGCAKCHDHMYDPILQKEYYQVRAIFEPHNVRIDRIRGQADIKKDGLARVFDAQPDVKTYFLTRGDDRMPDKSKPLEPGVPEALGGLFGAATPVKLPARATSPDKRDFVIEEDIHASAAAIRRNDAPARLQEMRSARLAVVQALDLLPLAAAGRLIAGLPTVETHVLAELQTRAALAKHQSLLRTLEVEREEDHGGKGSAEWLGRALAAVEAQRRAAFTETQRAHVAAGQAVRLAAPAKRAEANEKLVAAEKAFGQALLAFLQTPTPTYVKRPIAQHPLTSTGRRLAFARWLSDEQNPLTARVAMNHVWLRHFHQPIVPSVFDFGRNGRPPSHPALLDWLAAEFMEPTPRPPMAIGGRGPWSMKHMHRLIVTSSAYRQASTIDAGNTALDRDNIYLWHMPSKRLEAEVVRDSVYYVANKLDPTQGGPDIDYNLGLSTPRRSLYFRHAQEKQMEFLKVFDSASVTECYQRKESVLPQQALALANSQMVRQHARLLARTLSSQHGESAGFVSAVFEQLLTRGPTPAELQECLTFLQQQAEQFARGAPVPADKGDGTQPSLDPALRARENLVHVLLNHHDFVTVR